MDVIGDFCHALSFASEYPKNLKYTNKHEYHLKKYFRLLNDDESRLFCPENEATVDFWELGARDNSFSPCRVSSIFALRSKLGRSMSQRLEDPRCRFLFVGASNSRSPLNITREMFAYYLTYHQVMPDFLDFVFSFGQQSYPKDFHFGGLRHLSHIRGDDRGVNIEQLGRSGRELQLSYNFKSAERSDDSIRWPWAIRQVAIHHSIDLENGRTTCTVIKANGTIRNRIKAATEMSLRTGKSSFDNFSNAFAASLDVHLILCDWVGENWRWYINFLEEQCQDCARDADWLPVNVPPRSTWEQKAKSLSRDVHDPKKALSRQSTIRTMMQKLSAPNLNRFMISKTCYSPETGKEKDPTLFPELAPCAEPEQVEEHVEFSFRDLQRLQYLEDRANEAKLVLEVDKKVLKALGSHYRIITQEQDFPHESRQSICERLPGFERTISEIVQDVQMQETRLQALLRYIVDRKSLLHTILKYRSMRTNGILAAEAHTSALRMANMTEDMHQIAEKTEQETVSMRIITLVTLFFLPGTFISTLMSTDIVQFERTDSGKPEKIFSPAALSLFFEISAPLMVMTFLAWWVVYHWVKYREVRRRLKRRALGDESV